MDKQQQSVDLSISSRHVGTLNKFLAHNALHYNCICAAEALKCTSELGMHKEEGQYNTTDQRSVVLYCKNYCERFDMH